MSSGLSIDDLPDNATSDITSTRTPVSEILIREIHKNGWLIKYSGIEKKYGFPKSTKSKMYWVMFCVHDDTNCFLEFYETKLLGFSHKPFCSINLNKCIHISPSIIIHEEEHEFIITLDNELIRLAALSREQMIEWIETIKNKLREIGVLNPKDNLYSKEPELPAILASSRDPSSPLPATPALSSIPVGTEVLFNSRSTISIPSADMNVNGRTESHIHSTSNSTNTSTVISIEQSFYSMVSGDLTSNNVNENHAAANVFTAVVNHSDERRLLEDTLPSPNHNTSPLPGNVLDKCNEPSYEQLFLASSSRDNQDGSTSSNSTNSSQQSIENRFENLNIYSGSQILSLREQQVLKLRREMQHEAGVRIILKSRDCCNSIAFVECFGNIWIAGWKQKECPLLHNVLHVGDRVLSVAGLHPGNIVQFQKIIMQITGPTVEFIVQRLPFGNVLVIKREFEGQNLGLLQENNTPEIKEVVPYGLANNFGLTFQASCIDKQGSCNWFITEVNNRSLNLFFKGTEVQERLNAVGTEISILVQPSDLIKAMKKQLKKLRNYKSYLVQ